MVALLLALRRLGKSVTSSGFSLVSLTLAELLFLAGGAETVFFAQRGWQNNSSVNINYLCKNKIVHHFSSKLKKCATEVAHRKTHDFCLQQ